MIKCPVCHQEAPSWRTQPPNLLQVALDVHMTSRGSFDRPAEDQARDVKTLEDKLKKWSGHGKGDAFSDAVRDLLIVTVNEANTTRLKAKQ